MSTRETLPRYELNGGAFDSFEGFVEHFNRVVLRHHAWNGSLDALDDILGGGFGTPDGGFLIVWKDHTASKRTLGHGAMANWLEKSLSTCHPDNVASMQRQLAEAEGGQGPTLFDVLLNIFQTHGPGGEESEDNVLVELA